MLATSTPFPFAGSDAVLAATGQRARILQRRGDGRAMISLPEISPGHPDQTTRATGTRTVDLSELSPFEPQAPAPRRKKVSRGDAVTRRARK